MFSEILSALSEVVSSPLKVLRKTPPTTLRFAASLCAMLLVATSALAQTPVCTPTVSPTTVARGGSYTITANCGGQPVANGYTYRFADLSFTVSSAGPSYTTGVNTSLSSQPGSRRIDVSNTNGATGTVFVNVLGQLACAPTATPSTVNPGDVVTLDGRCTEDGRALPASAFSGGGYAETWSVPGIGNFTRDVSLVTFTVPANATAGTTFNATVIATNNNIPSPPTSSVAASTTITVRNNIPPTAAITSPANNSTFTAPATINIAANAADSDGTIQRVEFYNGTTLLGTATAAPYTFSWTNVAAGSYALTARAFDNLGAQGNSAVVNISVANAAPTVSITSPANNATFTAPATIPFTATASAPGTTITRVDYLVNNVVIGSATAPPFAFSWQNVAAGNYSVTPRVVPAAGNPVDGAAINVIVSNAPATVAIATPANNATFTAPATIPFTATASAPGTTITRVEYLVNNAVIGSATAAPFAFNWQNVPAGSYAVTPRVVPAVGNPVTGTPINVVVGNAPPTVAITSPASGANFTAPANISLAASATAPGTTVTRVEYLVNNAVIGQATVAPYAFTWTSVQPGNYAITARVVPAAGAQVVSAPITVTVGTPAAPSVACRVDSPPAITITQGASLTANCTRNGVAISSGVLGANETVSYQWRAIGAAPVASSTTNVLTFPAGTFKKSGNYDYGVVATITNSLFAASSATSPEAIGTIKVDRTVTSITITTPLAQRKVVPGEKVSFTFVVRDSEGPVPDREVLWAIMGGNVKRTATKSAPGKAFPNCVADDLPKPLPVFTNPQGEGTVSFIAGCATGGRDVLLTSGSVTEMVKLSGPDQLATKTVLLAGATLVIAEPGKATAVPVGVIDSAGAKVVSSTTTWSIDPATAGTISPIAVSDGDGVARSTLTLNTGVSKAELQVCIEGRPNTCVRIPVRNTVTAVAEPGTAIVQPIMRQAIEAPRVQINNIRNRLQQLRVEESFGGVAGSDKSGEGAAPKASPFGLFVLGEVDLAKRQSASGETTYKLQTKGVTVGADYRLGKSFVVGGAFGALIGDTTFTSGDQKTKGYSGSLFAQWLPTSELYANAIVNAGTNRIDNRRTSVGGDSLTARGNTTQQGFQIESGYALAKDGVRFTPFARYEYIRAKLKPFEESGGMDALAISGQTLRANTFGLGAIAEYAISTSSGVWIPSGRIEFLNESQKQNAVFARLVNGTPVLVPLSPEVIDKNFGTWGLNLQWLTGPSGNLISSFIGYEQTFGKTGFKNDRFTAGVKIPF